MLASLPVVFACRAGNDPVGEYECGFSADPEDAQDIADVISRLYFTPELERSLMGGRGYNAVMSFYVYERLALNLLQALKVDAHVAP
jgi:glycosyltransferase involved in cell wall biosynthesis